MAAIPKLTKALARGPGREQFNVTDSLAVRLYEPAACLAEKIALNSDLAAEVMIVDRHGFFPAIVSSLNPEAERFKSNANAAQTGAKLHGHPIPAFGRSLAHRVFRLLWRPFSQPFRVPTVTSSSCANSSCVSPADTSQDANQCWKIRHHGSNRRPGNRQ
jgi:hypothetical protein